MSSSSKKKKTKIETLKALQDKYPSLYETIEEYFVGAKKKLKNFDVDVFSYDEKTLEFWVTLSCGISEELEIFDISGEMEDSDVSVHNASFERSLSSEDLYDTENAFTRDWLDEEEDGESDY